MFRPRADVICDAGDCWKDYWVAIGKHGQSKVFGPLRSFYIPVGIDRTEKNQPGTGKDSLLICKQNCPNVQVGIISQYIAGILIVRAVIHSLDVALTWTSIRISPVMMLDAKNINLAVSISLLSRVQAEIYVISYPLPVTSRHLW